MDDLWYSDYHTNNVKLSIKVDKQLHKEESDYQKIVVYESFEFGKFITLDGFMMFTERDEFIYNEMMSHIPMAVNPNIKNILIIGSGDGGIPRELTKYKTIEHIDVVELDERVVEICREFFPVTSSGLDDERITLHIRDGLKFIRPIENKYDLIVVDSTNPTGPSEILFTKEFFGNCYKALKEDGIMISQHESPFYKKHGKAIRHTHKRISNMFPVSKAYQSHIPSYPSGHWLFGFASKKYNPLIDLKEEYWNSLGIKTKYYNTDLHKGSFYLPNYVMEELAYDE